jgi:uncharacterized protein YwgA
MTAYDFVHLALFAVGGEVRGKTKLQKTVYFLGLLSGQLEALGYRAHYYGPYSDEVADAVRLLQVLGFVDRVVAGCGICDDRGFEIRRTDVKLTDDGAVIARRKAAEHPDEWRRLTEAARMLHEAGDMDYVKLSVAAKTFFLLREKGRATTTRELLEEAKHLGWEVSGQQVRDATAYLQRLNLVQPTRA